MKKYNSLKELEEKAPEMIYEEIKAFLEITAEPEKFDVAAANFITFMGGNVYIVDRFPDLYDIQFYGDFGLTNIVVTDCAFDDAYILAPYCSYYVITIITNDAGGDVYYIPREVATKCVKLMEAFESSRVFSFKQLARDTKC